MLADGHVRCWGFNRLAALDTAVPAGCGSPFERGDCFRSATPVRGVSGVTDVAVGFAHACARTTEGRVVCWGDNYYGACGVENPHASDVTAVTTAVVGAVDVEAGAGHSCARTEDGAVYCWGASGLANFGVFSADVDHLHVPVEVRRLCGAFALGLGDAHTCGAIANGTVLCAGFNRYSQTGMSSPERCDGLAYACVHEMTAVPGLVGVRVLAAGGHFTCALRDGGDVTCWGDNTYGELGTAAATSTRTHFVLPGAVDIAAGGAHACALRADGRVLCWGYNESGQVGSRGRDQCREMLGCVLAPRLIDGLEDVAEIALGSSFSCARRRDGAVLCWGLNDYGQLGDGTLTNRETPGLVIGL